MKISSEACLEDLLSQGHSEFENRLKEPDLSNIYWRAIWKIYFKKALRVSTLSFLLTLLLLSAVSLINNSKIRSAESSIKTKSESLTIYAAVSSNEVGERR